MKVAVLIDGGHLRALAHELAGHKYNPGFIVRFANACIKKMTKKSYGACSTTMRSIRGHRKTASIRQHPHLLWFRQMAEGTSGGG